MDQFFINVFITNIIWFEEMILFIYLFIYIVYSLHIAYAKRTFSAFNWIYIYIDVNLIGACVMCEICV